MSACAPAPLPPPLLPWQLLEQVPPQLLGPAALTGSPEIGTVRAVTHFCQKR